jgi:5-methylthioadenosine/S-adenosylhomocysteine deaminase
LDVGKKADIIMVNLNKPHLTPTVFKPIRNLVPNLVYQAHGTEVTTVIVNGKLIMEDRKLMTLDEEKILQDAQKAAEELTTKAESDYLEADSQLVKMMNEGNI